MSPAIPSGFPEAMGPFLARQGLTGHLRWTRLPGGANNRVFHLQDDRHDWVLKHYFHDPADRRDRFGVERRFYEFLWQHQMRCIPEPIAFDTQQRAGLFAYVSARKLNPTEINQARMAEAIAFITGINHHRNDPAARSLPAASEACFSQDEHRACVDRRVKRLVELAPRDELEQQARDFVQMELAPAWQDLRARIDSEASRRGGRSDQTLAEKERCLSPSDFGFHNALLGTDDRLRFIDFEYAGWDDPVKLICDFFCQPQVPVQPEYWDGFAQALRSQLDLPEHTLLRARLLWPVYQTKWCCIMLNEFVRGDRDRRAFASVLDADLDRRAGQLAKAAQALRRARELWSCQF
jgi:hypothetical protein